jgi:hypothetical protein
MIPGFGRTGFGRDEIYPEQFFMTGHAMVKWDYKLPTQVIQVYDRP